MNEGYRGKHKEIGYDLKYKITMYNTVYNLSLHLN